MFSTIHQAVSALMANKARTVLTILGIIIGIATVVIVLSAGEGFRGFINAQAASFGTNFITIETRVPPTTRDRAAGGQTGTGGNAANLAQGITSLKMRDIEDISRLANISGGYGAVIGQQVVAYKNITKNAFVFGANADRFTIDKGELASGRFYSEQEDIAASQVAILGFDIAVDLFGDDDPVGKMIRVGSFNFEVIGVYKQRGSFGFSNDDQQVFIPLTTIQKKLLGIDHLFYGLVQVRDPDQTEATAEDMRAILRRNHGITDPFKDDFVVQSAASSLDTFNTVLQGVTFLLIAIAAISLLVGGVGIMNIMYVAVTERTSEIGLKKALGARRSAILWEFLVETIILTLGGGALGVVFGALISYLVAVVAQSFEFAWVFKVPVFSVVLGLGVAGIIGLVFGVFPARRASKLDPIEALRYE